MILVKDLMTARVVTIGPNDPMKDAVEKILSGRFRRIPVVEKGRVVGIITDRDIRQTLNSPVLVHERSYDDYVLHEVKVAGSMTPDPLTISPAATIIEAVELMESRKIGGLPVVDDGELVGIITESDLMRYLVQLLRSGQ
jgi:acetoin utilization protein AcuB